MARRIRERAMAVGTGNRMAVVDRRERGEIRNAVFEITIEPADIPPTAIAIAILKAMGKYDE